MLRCYICHPTSPGGGHGAPLVALATSNYVAWCISSDAFVNRCHVSPNGAYTTDMSTTSVFSLHANTGSEVSLNSLRVCIDDVSRTFALPLTNAGDASDSRARIGQTTVTYDRLLYTSDMQAYSGEEGDGSNANGWTFVDSSANATFRWSADGSHSYITATMDPCVIRVQKARNDAACDYIRAGTAGTEAEGAPHPPIPPNLSTSAADTLVGQFDFAETLANDASGPSARAECAISGAGIAVTLSDSTFTDCVTQVAATHGAVQNPGPFTTTASLRNALHQLISGGYICGLRSITDVSIPCGLVLSGTDRTAEAPILDVTPQLFFHKVD